MTLFPIIVYVQKRKTGLWPFGFAPFVGQIDDFHANRYFWKKMKVNLAVQLIAFMVALSLFVLYVDILEFRDKGCWWAPIASESIIGMVIFIVFVNSNNYHRKKYSMDCHE
ncbi:MAG: hypothetical protein HRT35_27225 [Algicola sp.]|nr:hypothetical protein [Algicola sp.]